MNQSIIACGRRVEIGVPVIIWSEQGGFLCKNKRGRRTCSFHSPKLNAGPTRKNDNDYLITDPKAAYEQLKTVVHQFILHYDSCYCSWHCNEILENHEFLGSHFYLDLDGTIYQTCDLYWKTNTAPADDRRGNSRAVHVEIANLSWDARKSETNRNEIKKNQYQKINGRWQLILPKRYQDKLRTPKFLPSPARENGSKGYFSRSVNGKTVNMWDYTEEQYFSLIRLCIGVNKLLPRIQLKIPWNDEMNEAPLDRLEGYASFCGILGHAHVQDGRTGNVSTKYDPGSAMDWYRLKIAFDQKLGQI
tara:strand:- start:4288 stop:5199 length:912 start_codon:yes stop_codon:yes gene_type:complete